MVSKGYSTIFPAVPAIYVARRGQTHKIVLISLAFCFSVFFFFLFFLFFLLSLSLFFFKGKTKDPTPTPSFFFYLYMCRLYVGNFLYFCIFFFCNYYYYSFFFFFFFLSFYPFVRKEERRGDDKDKGLKGWKRERESIWTGRKWVEGEGKENHTDPNKMSLSASFPGATPTISLRVAVVVVVVVLAVDILANCSAAFLSLDKVVRLLLTASVIRTPPGGD